MKTTDTYPAKNRREIVAQQFAPLRPARKFLRKRRRNVYMNEPMAVQATFCSPLRGGGYRKPHAPPASHGACNVFIDKGMATTPIGKAGTSSDQNDVQIAPFEQVTSACKELLQNAVQATVLKFRLEGFVFVFLVITNHSSLGI